MTNPIKEIYRFNKEAGLLENGYSDFLEDTFTIEESLEGHEDLLGNYDAKTFARELLQDLKNNDYNLKDVDRLDKALDKIVFAFGSIFKLGLTPQQATKALNVVMHANLAKLQMPKDEHGKLTKPANFEGPEEQLQSILDER